jgi:hypothetical protein
LSLAGSARCFGLIGSVSLATAGMRFCPHYTRLGVRAYKV